MQPFLPKIILAQLYADNVQAYQDCFTSDAIATIWVMSLAIGVVKPALPHLPKNSVYLALNTFIHSAMLAIINCANYTLLKLTAALVQT